MTQSTVPYLFKSERLGFRSWTNQDFDEMFKINNDEKVMEFFPSLADETKTANFITKMQDQFNEYQYCYFATERLINQEFLGFIGITKQDHGLDRGDFIDIGWRLKQNSWGKGLATEGAMACLSYAKSKFEIDEIYSIATKINIPSIRVMEKIGMKYRESFEHPRLIDHPKLKECVLYHINL